MDTVLDWIALALGIYCGPTGIWPLLHLPSFLAVTGDKVEKWLVRTVGALIAIIAGVLVVSALRSSVDLEVILLAVGSASALGLVDVIYVSVGRIPPIYLADAAAEAALLAAWAVAGAF